MTNLPRITRFALSLTPLVLLPAMEPAFEGNAGMSAYTVPETGWINVVEALGAVGDGVTDNTPIFARFTPENIHDSGTFYFPDGVYVFSDTLYLGNKRVILQVQSRERKVLRLRADSPGFDDVERGKPFVSTHGRYRDPKSAMGQAFKNSIFNLTLEVGADNPGAVAIHSYETGSNRRWPKGEMTPGLFVRNVMVEGYGDAILSRGGGETRRAPSGRVEEFVSRPPQRLSSRASTSLDLSWRAPPQVELGDSATWTNLKDYAPVTRTRVRLNGRKVAFEDWGPALQLNPESNPKNDPQGSNVRVNGGTFRVLGIKTEYGHPVLEARDGARVELLGGWSYHSGSLGYLDENSQVTLAGILTSHGHFSNALVREVEGGRKRDLTPEIGRHHQNLDGSFRKYGTLLPLYLGH